MKRNYQIALVLAALSPLTLLLAAPPNLQAATITATSTADSGDGTLRNALAAAADGDTIDATGITGTILLTSGELRVSKSATIVGPGPSSLAVNGNHASRVFHIAPSNTVTIVALTITNGYVIGTLPAYLGGGIYNERATLTVSNCAVSGNSTVGNGILGGDGGGIANDGRVSGANLIVVNSTLSGNSATNGFGLGAAIFNWGTDGGTASVQIVSSTINGNLAYAGGGIYNFGLNDFGYSGGSASLRIINSAVSGNFGGQGGGIGNDAYSGVASVEIVNSTLSSNSAYVGGGIYNQTQNSISTASVQIINSTLSGNFATSGGADGIYSIGAFGSGMNVEIGSTVLNSAGYYGNIYNLHGTVTSLGYNLSSDDAGGFLTATGDQTNTPPLLGPLQDNGGPTFTHALLVCSPAIDQGYNFSASITDKRDDGFVRTFDDPAVPNATGGDGTDIGAFEAQAPIVDTTPPTIICPDNIVTDATSPTGAVVSFSDPTAYDNCSVASVSCSPASGSTFAVGTTTVSCRAIDGSANTNACTFTIHVKGAAEQISDLTALVQSFGLKAATSTSLVAKLQAAGKDLSKGNEASACSDLQDLIGQCTAQMGKKQITAEQASQMIADATRIRAVIGCM